VKASVPYRRAGVTPLRHEWGSPAEVTMRQDDPVTVLVLERPNPITQLRIWRGGESPDGQALAADAIVVEWTGRTGHPTSYALLGIVPTDSDFEVSIPASDAPYLESLAGGSDQVSFGSLTDEQVVAIRDALGTEHSNGWNVAVAASGLIGSSQMSFRWVAGFIRLLMTQTVAHGPEDQSIWSIWDQARPW
jgi:hypothetical protein